MFMLIMEYLESTEDYKESVPKKNHIFIFCTSFAPHNSHFVTEER